MPASQTPRLTRAEFLRHSALGAGAFAVEAQLFLGIDEVITERPLRFVLDRRPFI